MKIRILKNMNYLTGGLILGITVFLLNSCNITKVPECEKPRVIVTTDINHMQGDPDDKQSMAHMLMYADELDIELIVPDRWNARGYESTMAAIASYEEDFNNVSYYFHELGYPEPECLRKKVATDFEDAVLRFIEAAQKDDPRPVYVLVWGNMNIVKSALLKAPGIASKLRVLTIGTNLMANNPDAQENAEVETYCATNNWNGPGRDEIYEDPRFRELWWIENDWAYNGMFEGQEPYEFLEEIKKYGALGFYIWNEVRPYDWAHYFRVGDTPTVLYLLEGCVRKDPSKSSWAGKFIRPFPEERPNYWTDDAGTPDWNYGDPCELWDSLFMQVYSYRVQGLLESRDKVYQAYRGKMELIYNKGVMD